MPADSRPAPGRKSPRAFALWVWTMLLVVLLSAAPTGAQTHTRLVGSAFDPTTVSVALSPKQPKAKASLETGDRRRVPDTASNEPSQLLLPAAAPAAIGGAAETAAGPFAGPAPLAPLRSLTRAHGPRAPPRA